MSMSRIRSWRFWAITVAAVVIAAPVLKARGSSSIPDQLGQLITMLQSVQQSLDGLMDVAESNVRITPPTPFGLATSSAFLRCIAMNTSSEPRTVRIEVIDATSGQVMNPLTQTLPPLTFGVTDIPKAPGKGVFSCRFTVLDGTRSDIRGELEIDDVGLLEFTLLTVPAE
jgi:hypothetical protein